MKHNAERSNLQIARVLRKNMTKEEKHLWYDFLSEYPIRFRRQERIGEYVADFYCEAARLAIELDGSQHCSEIGMESDAERTAVLDDENIAVVRFLNEEIWSDFSEVCRKIDFVVQSRIENFKSK